MHIVWFKRDLRIEDHEATTQAAKHRSILLLYILEPELWKQPDMSHRHYIFLQDCLSELSHALEKLVQKLIIKVGNADDVLKNCMNAILLTAYGPIRRNGMATLCP